MNRPALLDQPYALTDMAGEVPGELINLEINPVLYEC
jgi:hypothetical protein